ncbi:propionyl-CoA synthetase [Friedmanniella luteola]|uniref:Propionyl-CoA synthetase n=1 Tax=Friedmanniella luteola TaxID=546871 RepID=A0A1H1LIY2_9ACTN|nr:AMP-binding protein [Friedmanniella luteola]SDR73819.1 propionyl-CoA synthetase [Friedmanniella luteola]
MSAYATEHRRSLDDPEAFWAEQARAVDWFTRPRTVLDREAPPAGRWFPDGVLNTCYNALDRHVVRGRADEPALIFHSAYSGTRRTYTYADLLQEVAQLGGGLRELGVGPGDRVVISMPMVPEAVVAMLACARLGAVHSVVFGGFAAAELAARIDDARPKVVLISSCGLEPGRVVEYKPLLDAALQRSRHQPDYVVVHQRPEAPAELHGERELDLAVLMRPGQFQPAGCAELAATDPLYILYTSGTTGKPKGIVRDHGGHAVALAYSMRAVYDIGPGDVMFTASDVGWVVGHSYIVYAPLLVGATTVLYEGKPVGTPDAGSFWRVVSEHRAKVLFTAPTAVRAIRRVDPDGALARRHDLSSLQALFLAGERLDPDTFHWAGELLGVPVVDHWWQTETGWPIAANPRGLAPLPLKAGSPSVPVPGYDVQALGPDGAVLPADQDGALCLRLPLPPGTLPTIWGDDDRFRRSYLETFPGWYLSGDGGHLDADGYVFVMGRTDDVINVAGHRLSTGSMEAVLASHPAVAECAVIGVADDLKGQVPRALVVLTDGVDTPPAQLAEELVALVRAEIGPVASLRRVDVVAALPKTRSGKLLRRTMREIADGGPGTVPSTVEDAGVVEQLRPVLRGDHPA